MTLEASGATIDINLWRRGSARLVQCAGRARVHDLRNALNAMAIGVELLAGDQTTRDVPRRARRAAAVRQAIGTAGAEVAGLSTLFAETAAPSCARLPDVIGWALEVAEPVARRRAVRFETATLPDDLPDVALSVGANVALALLFVETCLTARRGSSCTVRFTADPIGVSVDWRPQAGAIGEGLDLARSLFQDVTGSRTTVSAKSADDLHQLVAELEPVH